MRWIFLALFIPVVVHSQTDDTHSGVLFEPSFGVMFFGQQETEEVGSGTTRQYEAQNVYVPAVLRLGYKFKNPFSLDLELPFFASYHQDLVYDDSPCQADSGCLEGERKLSPFSLGGSFYLKAHFRPKLTARLGVLRNHLKLWQNKTGRIQFDDATTRAEGKILATDDKLNVLFFSLGIGFGFDIKAAKVGLGYRYVRIVSHRPEYVNDLDTEFRGSNNHRIEANFIYPI